MQSTMSELMKSLAEENDEFPSYTKERVSLVELKAFSEEKELKPYSNPYSLSIGLRDDEEELIKFVSLVDLKEEAVTEELKEFAKSLSKKGAVSNKKESATEDNSTKDNNTEDSSNLGSD